MRDTDILMEGVKVLFKNFAGNEGEFNRKGARNFNVVLPPKVADQMEKDGYNVRTLRPRENDEGEQIEPDRVIKVSVNFKGIPPKIFMISSRGRTRLDESTVMLLDYAYFKNVDLIVGPYNWKLKTGASGISCYLQSMYVTIEEDALDEKYAHVNDVPQAGVYEED